MIKHGQKLWIANKSTWKYMSQDSGLSMRLSDKTVKSISKSIAAGYCSPSIWESVYSLDYFVIMATNHLSTIMWAKSPFVCWSRLRIFLINSMISRFSSVFFPYSLCFHPNYDSRYQVRTPKNLRSAGTAPRTSRARATSWVRCYWPGFTTWPLWRIIPWTAIGQ